MFIVFVLFLRNSICLSTADFEKYNAGTLVLLSMMYCHLFHQCSLKLIIYAQQFGSFTSCENGICIASIFTFMLYMFNFINTYRKFRGGENRKTEIQKKGVGGGGGIFIYVFIYYNYKRWSKGVGVLGCPSMPCLPLPRQSLTPHLPSPTPLGEEPSASSC